MSDLLRSRLTRRAAPWLLAAALVSAAGCPVVQPPGQPAAGNGVKVVDIDPNSPSPKGGTAGPPNPQPLDVSNLPSITGKRFALLVGVKDYDSPDFRNLNFTEADVEDLAQTLRGDGYDPADIVVMTRKHAAQDPALMPTVENIRAQLDALLKRCGKDDVVLVGLTGHGVQPKDGKQFFCGYQAVLSDLKGANPKTLLPIEEVYQRLGACPAALKVLMVDACRDDPEAKGPRRTSEDYKTVTSGPTQAGVIALYSCSEGESSWEPTELQHGVFFHFLIEGLQGKADLHQDGRITWTELVDYLVSNVDLYAVTRLKQRQRPHFKGESNADQPLAVRSGARAPEVPLQTVEGVLLDEDFRGVTPGGPPRGWDGDGFSVVKDADGRACLEVIRKEGQQTIELPRMALTGDFYIEVETLLDGSAYNVEHNLSVQLEGKSGAVLIPVVVNYLGWVTVQNGQTVKVENFTPYKRARVRLTREGNKLSLALNGEVRTGVPLDFTGVFDTVRLGLTAGMGHGLGTTAKIYSVKIGLLNNDAHPPPPPPDRVLLKEDFKQAGLGGPPAGWTGDGFSVVQDKNGRACLEVNKKEGPQAIELPRVALTGDFYVEVETLLDGARGDVEHFLYVQLEARGGAVRVPVRVAYNGMVFVGTGAPGRQTDGFQPYGITRVRVAREGKNLQVSLNGLAATGLPLEYAGDFDTVWLGLTSGIPGGGLRTTAKIYSVKIGLPGEGAMPPPPPALPDGVHENFSKASVGGLPDGWAAGTPARNLSVQQTGEHRDLELANPAAGGDVVRLPQKNLNGNYYIEFAAEYPSEDTTVALQLTGGAKVIPLLLTLDGHGTLSAIGKQAPGFQGKGAYNVLGLERGDKGYVIKLNGEQVAAPPLAAAPGPFDTVCLLVGLKDKNQSSPRVRSVLVQPLP